MSKTVKQIYDENPITTMLPTDLLYVVRDPYNSSDNAAVAYQDLGSSSPSDNYIVKYDANKNISASNFIEGYTTTVTSAGTTTLTISSTNQQYFTGVTTQTVVMPVVSTLQLGMSWTFINNSTGNITVNSSGGNLISTILPTQILVLTCAALTGTTATSWKIVALPGLSNISFTGNNNDIPLMSTYYSSAYILGVFYPNLITMSHAFASTLGPSTIDYGNVQLIVSSLFTVGGLSVTSIVANNLLAIGFSPNILPPLLTSLSMPLLLTINQAMTVTTPILVTFSLPSLVNMSGLIITAASLTTINLPAVTQIPGGTGLTGTVNSLTTLTLTNLQGIGGPFSLTANALTTLSMPALIAIGTNFAPTATSLSTVNMPSLTSVGGTFSPTLAALTTLTLTSLQSVVGAFGLTAATLTTLSLPALTTLGAGFSPVCASATTVTLTSLANITGAVAPSFAALTTLSFPAIVSASSTWTITAANLVTFSLGSTLKSIGGNFTMTGMKLNQASVDGILVSLAALDGTNGTTAYSSRTINLSGGTSSAPSATGLAAKVTLQARSCTVTTN